MQNSIITSILVFAGLGNYLFLARLQMILCSLANLGTIYLSYVLFVILEDVCVVCISTYVLNFFLLIASLYRISTIKSMKIETGGPIIYGGKTKKRV